MNRAEFDQFADEYRNLHAQNIKVSGEDPEFFAAYKVADVAGLAKRHFAKGPLKILDFGAGVGNSIGPFRQHFPDAELTCADVSPRSLEIARERFHDQARYLQLDERVPALQAGYYDIAFSACVFHHIPPQEHGRVLKLLTSALAPRGLLVIFEHNPFNPLTVRAVNTCPFDENAQLISGPRMVDQLRRAGLARPALRYRLFFPGFLRRLRGLEPGLAWLPLGAQYYVCGEKPADGSGA